MYRFLVFLIGTAVLGSIMAAVYYDPDNVEQRELSSAFNLAPGEVRQDGIPPSLPGSPIVYEFTVLEGEVDIYLMDKEWAEDLSGAGQLNLSKPFSYYKQHSAEHVNSSHSLTLTSDGETWFSVILDNSDNYYAGDSGEDQQNATNARVRIEARFLAEEDRSLTLGYLAAIPSVLLIVVTVGRHLYRWGKERKESLSPGAKSR